MSSNYSWIWLQPKAFDADGINTHKINVQLLGQVRIDLCILLRSLKQPSHNRRAVNTILVVSLFPFQPPACISLFNNRAFLLYWFRLPQEITLSVFTSQELFYWSIQMILGYKPVSLVDPAKTRCSAIINLLTYISCEPGPSTQQLLNRRVCRGRCLTALVSPLRWLVSHCSFQRRANHSVACTSSS